jgi:hypothetical protein
VKRNLYVQEASIDRRANVNWKEADQLQWLETAEERLRVHYDRGYRDQEILSTLKQQLWMSTIATNHYTP